MVIAVFVVKIVVSCIVDITMERYYLVFLFLISFKTGAGIIGYDCSGKQWKSYLRYDATQVSKCPEIEGWFNEERLVQAQVIRVPQKNRLKVMICEIRTSRRAHYCGIDSILHGVEFQLDEGVPHRLSRSDCEDLVYRQTLHYKGHNWTDERRQFTREAVTEGWRDAVNGKCSPSAKPFSEGQLTFRNHILREVVTATILEHYVEYPERDEAFKINEVLVDVKDEFWSTARQQYVWTDPKRSCDRGFSHMIETYSGEATLLEPSNPNLSRMILVNNKKQTFALEIPEDTKTTSICNYEMFPTNLLDVMVTFNASWFNSGRGDWYVPGLKTTELVHLDPVQDIKGYAGFNFAQNSHRLSHVMAELAKENCETKRKATMTSLSVMRVDPEEGAYNLFGRGYNALLKGSSFLVYKCERKEFTYRHSPNDYQDIPVSYVKNGTEVEGFLDSVTFKLKSSSISYENHGEVPVYYNFGEDDWRCKQNSLIDCSSPRIMSHDFEVERQHLDLVTGVFEYKGGLQDIKTRRAFRDSVWERPDVRASFDGLTDAIVDNAPEDNIKDKMNVGVVDKTLDETSFYANRWSLGLKIFGCISGLIGVWMIGCRLHLWRKAKSEFKTALNFFHACFNPSQFFTNIDFHQHKALHNQLEEVLVVANGRSVSASPPPSFSPDVSLPPSQQIHRLSGSYFQFPGQPHPPPSP